MSDTTFAEAKVHCAGCGGNVFERPADPQPDDMVVCHGCRREWRYADLKASAKDKALDAVKELVRDVFKNAGLE